MQVRVIHKSSAQVEPRNVIKESGFVTFCVLYYKIHPENNMVCFRNMAERTLRVCEFDPLLIGPFISKIATIFCHQVVYLQSMDRTTKMELVQDWIFEMNVVCGGQSENFHDGQMKDDYTLFLECDMEGMTNVHWNKLCWKHLHHDYYL